MELTFEDLYGAYKKCKKSVSWKTSVALYGVDLITKLNQLQTELANGTYKESVHRYFKLYAPKEREIMSLTFRDRIYQRALNDKYIYPIVSKSFIYDNGASQPGKGTDFSRNRLKTHLHKFFRETGSNEGYIVQIDIKKYYPSMDHAVVKEVFKKKLPEDVFLAAEAILDSFDGDVGYYAGSQLIQIAGLLLLNDCDHYLKEKMRAKHYIRYMDDILILCRTKEEAQEMFNAVKMQAELKKCHLHERKSRIYKLSKGIDFLGYVYKLTSTGKVIMAVQKTTVRREKRRLRILVNLKQSPRSLKPYTCQLLLIHVNTWHRSVAHGVYKPNCYAYLSVLLSKPNAKLSKKYTSNSSFFFRRYIKNGQLYSHPAPLRSAASTA